MKKIGKYSLIGISVIIGLVMVIAIFREIPMLDIQQAFKQATFPVILGFLVVSVAIMTLLSWRWQVIIGTRKKVSLWRIIPYKIVGYGISFITPAAKVGGEPLRAMMLQREGFSFKEGFATVAIDKIIDLTTSGFLFIIGVLVAISSFAIPEETAMLLMVFMVVVIALIIWFYFMLISDKKVLHKLFIFLKLNKFPKLKKTEKNIIEMDELLVNFYKNHKSSFNKAMLISAIAWLLMFLEYKFALMIVGVTNISFAGIFLIITMMGAAYLVPVPLALGVLEAGQISVFSLLRLSSASAVGLSSIIRARDFMWTLIGIGVLATRGINIRKAYDKSIQEGGIHPPKKEIKKINKYKSNIKKPISKK